MHVTERDGLRAVTFTEDEFDVIHNGFLSFSQRDDCCDLDDGDLREAEYAERLLGDALSLLLLMSESTPG